MNSLKQDLEGKIVILDKQCLKPEYHDIKYRVFQVIGGFGVKPSTIGTALYGKFLCDDEQARMEGYQVERLATQDDIDLALATKSEARNESTT